MGIGSFGLQPRGPFPGATLYPPLCSRGVIFVSTQPLGVVRAHLPTMRKLVEQAGDP